MTRKEPAEGQFVEGRVLAAQDPHARLHDQAGRGVVLLLEAVPKDGLVVHVVVVRLRLVYRLHHGLLEGPDNALAKLLGLVVAQLRVLVVAEIQLGAQRELGVLRDLESGMRSQLGGVDGRILATLHDELLVGVPAHVEHTARHAVASGPISCGNAFPNYFAQSPLRASTVFIRTVAGLPRIHLAGFASRLSFHTLDMPRLNY